METNDLRNQDYQHRDEIWGGCHKGNGKTRMVYRLCKPAGNNAGEGTGGKMKTNLCDFCMNSGKVTLGRWTLRKPSSGMRMHLCDEHKDQCRNITNAEMLNILAGAETSLYSLERGGKQATLIKTPAPILKAG
jgi:hypothetical protein